MHATLLSTYYPAQHPSAQQVSFPYLPLVLEKQGLLHIVCQGECYQSWADTVLDMVLHLADDQLTPATEQQAHAAAKGLYKQAVGAYRQVAFVGMQLSCCAVSLCTIKVCIVVTNPCMMAIVTLAYLSEFQVLPV